MNIEKIKRMLLITIGVMTAIMGYYIWDYHRENPEVKPEPMGEVPDADVVVHDVELVEYLNERVLWILRAKEAAVYSSLKETRGKNVEVDFFDKNGIKTLHLISDHGVKDDQTGNITASGNVQAHALHEESSLKAEELFYNAETEQILSDKHVIIERGNMSTTGEGLESDLSLSKLKILRNVMTTLTMPKEEDSPIIIVSDILELDNLAQLATYTGNVVVTQDSSEIRAETMYVYINSMEGAEDNIERIEILGNVRITQKNILVTGESGEYIGNEQIAVVKGTAEKQARAEDKTENRALNADIIRVFLVTNDFEGEGNVTISGINFP